ncbi:MAG: molybdenum cofactor guanylyltransferase MobA [Halioglobus sp.]|nr:molybdenum cofactor guanylyltransferase MobA [Halioglobus sp.]
MIQKNNVTGLILAGGAGRRVGDRDKGLIPWHGKPLVAHVRNCLKPQVAELLISCNRNVSRYKKFSRHAVSDNRGNFQGPLAGLEAAAPYILTDFVVVVSCDTPHLPDDLVYRLIAPLTLNRTHSTEISYVHDGVRAQYLCAAMRSSCLTFVTPYLNQGYRAVGDWYKTRNAVTVDFSDCESSFRNYNRLE